MSDTIRDNQALRRFELEIDGHLAFATYRRDGAKLFLPHVEAAPPLRGTGAAGRLMRGIMAHAERDGLKVVPICPYAAAWLRRHEEFRALVA